MGLSQMQLADKRGGTQSTYAGWEPRTTALKPEYILKIALALDVSVDYLLGNVNGGQRKGGPVGKARRVFEEVSKLPRQNPRHRRGSYRRSARPEAKKAIGAWRHIFEEGTV
jgi:transcriptional regulator with XRE-family HTH domain